MSYNSYSKSTATVPGPVFYARHRYAYLRIWHPTPWPASNVAKVLVRFHGGNPQFPFEDVARRDPTNAELNAPSLANKFVDNGYVFINCEYPQGGSPSPISGTAAPIQAWPLGVHPVPAFFVARAIQWIKRHYNDSALWGAGKSIDPEKILAWGNSGGGVALLLSQWALNNSGVGSYHEGYPASLNTELPTESAKVRALYNDGAAINFAQIDPLVCPSATMSFFTQAFLYQTTAVTDPTGFAQVPLEQKKRASPWFHLIREEVGNRIPIYSKYPTVDGLGRLLSLVDHPADQVKTGLYGPDDPAFAQALDNELRRQGIPCKTLWGNASNNPTGAYSMVGAELANDLYNWVTPYMESSFAGF